MSTESYRETADPENFYFVFIWSINFDFFKIKPIT